MNYCVWCKNKFTESFKPDKGWAKSLMCPICSSCARWRMMLYFFKEHSNLFNGKEKTVIEFSPWRKFKKFLKEFSYLNYYTIDIRIGKDDLVQDITNLGIKNNSVDVIICCHVLEHVKDNYSAMQEIHRILNPNGGWALIIVPQNLNLRHTLEDDNIRSYADRIKYYLNRDHVRMYGRDFKNHLSNVNLDVEEIRCDKLIGEEKAQQLGFTDHEPFYLCKKKR